MSFAELRQACDYVKSNDKFKSILTNTDMSEDVFITFVVVANEMLENDVITNSRFIVLLAFADVLMEKTKHPEIFAKFVGTYLRLRRCARGTLPHQK